MLSEELQQIVFLTIEVLPEDLRMAIMLRELNGMSYEEIAFIMGFPPRNGMLTNIPCARSN
ncbi:MAG: hypothetical protein GPOALKHO_000110 [Sodalis sp.]|nr:MAG: hypothetical protein GPOALKHO_000110 [Sodalis sp.]